MTRDDQGRFILTPAMLWGLVTVVVVALISLVFNDLRSDVRDAAQIAAGASQAAIAADRKADLVGNSVIRIEADIREIKNLLREEHPR